MKERLTYNDLKKIVEHVNACTMEDGREFKIYSAYGAYSVREIVGPGRGLAYYGDYSLGTLREAAENFGRKLLADGYEFEGINFY